MNPEGEPFFSDEFDTLLNNNFNGNDFFSEIEIELERNSDMIENIVFGEEVNVKMYNLLDEDTSRKILDTFDKNSKNEKESCEEFALVQCTNCDDTFANEAFKMHVCEYDENKKILPLEIIQENTENAFDSLFRNTIKLINENRSRLQKITEGYSASLIKDDKAKQSTFECFVCNRKFVHESGLYRHYDKHIGEMIKPAKTEDGKLHSVILCVFCGQTFPMEDENIWNHLCKNHLELDENNNSKTYVKFMEKELQFGMQDITDISLSTKKQAMNIAKTSNNSDTIRLPAQNFPINEFVRMIYVSKLYHCEYCDSVFANHKSLLHHVSRHEPSSYFGCQTCDLKLLSLKDILIHRHDECLIKRDYRRTLNDIPHCWMCNVCDEEFLGIEQLILHRHSSFHFFPRMEYRTNQLLFVCEYCKISFETADTLVSHLHDRHLKKPRIVIQPETSTRTLKSPTRRGGGHQTSIRPRQYLCEICGKSYTQSSHLWQHLRFHQGVKPFSCPHQNCGRRFTIRPDLNDHIRKCHTGERPFICTVCGKRFLTGSVYYQHRLIHRGERRYGCEECGKRFYRADALKNHQRIHSGEKPFACWVEGCQKSFRQRGDRDKHVKSRHKNAPPMSSPKKKKIKSFGLGRTKNNVNLYTFRPENPMGIEIPYPSTSA